MLAFASSPASSGPDESAPDDLVEAGRYGTARDGFDHSLVVLALGEACWLLATPGGFGLMVEPAAAPRVRAELARYDRESVGWPPPAAMDTTAPQDLDLVTPLMWGAVVLAVYRGQVRHPAWTDAGVLDPAAVFGRGEWWRILTALFLHANAEHLASNLLAGIFIFAAVLSGFGRARGWLLVGLAGVAGNLAVAAAHRSGPYRSLGASTAIFGALGLLTGRAVRVAVTGRRPRRWRLFFAPAAAGLTLLALYGAGGPDVDVLAHFAGFGAGAILGFFSARSPASA